MSFIDRDISPTEDAKMRALNNRHFCHSRITAFLEV